MNNEKRQQLFFNLLVAAFALLYFAVLFLNIDYLKVPHGDIYQYIDDAKHYAQFKLPWLIQLQPLTPILIALLEPFFASFAFPYFAAAKFINIAAAAGTLIFTYLLAKKHLHAKVALVIALLYAIHPLTLLAALDITTIGLYIFFVTAALYFLDSNKKLFMVMTALAFLVRIEGLILLAVYAIEQVFKWKKLKNTALANKENFVLAIIKDNASALVLLFFAIVLTSCQTLHNLQHNIPYGNQYLNELSAAKPHVESFVYLYGSIGALFFPQHFVWWGIDLFNPGAIKAVLMAISILFMAQAVCNKKTRPYGLYILLLALLHSFFFPANEYRYFLLFLNILVVSIVTIYADYGQRIGWNWLRYALKFLAILLVGLYVGFASNQIKKSFTDYREIGLDLYYSTSQWLFNSMPAGQYYIFAEKEYLYSQIFLNSQAYLASLSSEQPVLVETTEIVTKISHGQKVLNFVQLARAKKKCQDLACLFQELGLNQQKASLVLITHQWSESQAKDYWWQSNGLFLIEALLQKKECLTEHVTFADGAAYRKVNFFEQSCYLGVKD